jgi:hypothetical protein
VVPYLPGYNPADPTTNRKELTWLA